MECISNARTAKIHVVKKWNEYLRNKFDFKTNMATKWLKIKGLYLKFHVKLI